MGKISTLHRLLIPVVLLVIVAAIALASIESENEVEAIAHNAELLAQSQLRLLTLTESLVGNNVKAGMRQLQHDGLETGIPRIQGTTFIEDLQVPNLYLGHSSQVYNFKLVDKVTDIFGGTATLFVKSGDDFIRVATNIRQSHRERAIGTKLNPNGKVIKAIREGKAYYGVVDILGNPYITGYEPMLDEHNEIIGLWYVGFEANIDVLRQAIENSRFLQSGFSAMLDENNDIRFLSSNIATSDAKKLLESRPSSWLFTEETVPSWNFKIIVGYPKREAHSAGLIRGLYTLFGGLVILAIVLTLFVTQLKKLVIKPIGGDPAKAISLVKAISAGELQDDGLEADENTLMSDMLNMRVNLRQMVDTLKQNANRLSLAASVFDHAHDAIFITDANVRIIQVNPAFERLTGFTEVEVIGKHPRDLHLTEFNQQLLPGIIKAINARGQWSGEIKNRHKNGKIYIASLDVSAVTDDQQNVSHYVGIFSDITLMKQQQASLEHMAYHDALTKLPNRILFADRLNQALAKARRSKEVFALSYIDLDGFKPINDLLGHEAGDELLKQLGERIRESLRMGDTIARIGGDEFALLLCDLKSDEEAKHTLERVLDCIKAPFLIKDQEVKISASAGILIGINPHSKPEDLIRQADQAMYQAKLGYGDTYQIAIDEISNLKANAGDV